MTDIWGKMTRTYALRRRSPPPARSRSLVSLGLVPTRLTYPRGHDCGQIRVGIIYQRHDGDRNNESSCQCCKEERTGDVLLFQVVFDLREVLPDKLEGGEERRVEVV